MSLAIVLYLVDVATNVDTLLCLMAMAIIIPFAIIGIMTGVEYSFDKDCDRHLFKAFYNKLWIAILALILVVAIPSKQTMYLMLGASYLENSPLPSKVATALELKLDSVIKDLRETKK